MSVTEDICFLSADTNKWGLVTVFRL